MIGLKNIKPGLVKLFKPFFEGEIFLKFEELVKCMHFFSRMHMSGHFRLRIEASSA